MLGHAGLVEALQGDVIDEHCSAGGERGPGGTLMRRRSSLGVLCGLWQSGRQACGRAFKRPIVVEQAVQSSQLVGRVLHLPASAESS